MKKIRLVSRKPLAIGRKIIISLIILSVIIVLSGCATEYYPPRNGEKQGAVKRQGFVSWSNGIGKNLPLSNPSFSVIGK